MTVKIQRTTSQGIEKNVVQISTDDLINMHPRDVSEVLPK